MSEKKHNYVYKITNLLNNKIYIGVHSTDDLNDGYMGSSKALENAIKKYGVENFKKEILVDFETKEVAYRLEKMLVDEKFVKRKDTYNVKVGGIGGSGKHSEETKRKMSKTRTGKPLSEEHRKRISEGMRGEKNHNFGKHPSEETRKKLRARKGPNLGKHFSEEHRKKLSIAKKGKHHSDETRRKMSEARRGRDKGKRKSEEARKKMSEAKTGKPWSAARREAYERSKKRHS